MFLITIMIVKLEINPLLYFFCSELCKEFSLLVVPLEVNNSDGSGSDFPGIERVGYFIFLNFRVSSGSGI